MTVRQMLGGSALLSIVLPAVLLTRVAHPVVTNVIDKPLFRGATIDPPTLALFQRACQNCHSENAKWPWYSWIPPASLLIRKDVENARQHVNFSNWQSYTPQRQRDLLSRIGSLVRNGQMPLVRYVWLHREAVLTAQDRTQIYRLSRAERKRLGRN